MILQERELTIRSAVPDDAEILTAWWNDGAVMAHAGFPNGLGTTAERVRAQIRRNEPGVSELLIVLCDGVPIGEMDYRSESKAFAEIGIKLCVSSMQNRGLGKRLLALLLEQLFELGFRTIRLDTNPNNLRAMHVYETLGFRRLGIRVDSWTDQLGRLQSAVDYELRPEDLKPWLNRNKPINTPRLLLAKGRPGDWRDLYENVWSHPETARYMYWSVTEDPADAPARMQRTIGRRTTAGASMKSRAVRPSALQIWIRSMRRPARRAESPLGRASLGRAMEPRSCRLCLIGRASSTARSVSAAPHGNKTRPPAD